MNCPHTGKPCSLPKTIHLTDIKDGKIHQLDMCSECGTKDIQALNLVLNPQKNVIQEAAWESFLDNLLKQLHLDEYFSKEKFVEIKRDIKNKDDLNNFLAVLMNEKQPVKPEIKDDKKCECGLSLEVLSATGRLGCAKCYETFKEFLVTIISSLQGGATMHVGKRPTRRDESIPALEKQMAVAVKEERYEDAAKFRDKIREIRSKSP